MDTYVSQVQSVKAIVCLFFFFKMKLILLLTILSCGMAVAYAIVCTTDYCDQIRCEPLEESQCSSSNQEYRENSSFCGCCALCITLLDENATCSVHFGIPNSAICREPLVCTDEAILIFASRSFHATDTSGNCRSVKTSSLTIYFKMKAVLLLALLSCFMAVAYSDLVCGSSYCKQNPCSSPVARSSCRSPSVYRANHAGKCACCSACVSFLDENAACKTYSKELGETPSAICREPLKCLKGVCTKVAPRK
ncbi:hypothetical protein K1T71_003853 [Dendrolimus kikuchii]|uniref:Uncharacterized protein n=1 Tax=Dendrolimus kikuchii TaxID=765133 RepID=A0ACC1D956_9NEOP|nr:hypothetical protein K1T71_003853 [Dendrolimus kikuchii]